MHIVAQYAHCRRSLLPLPEATLRNVGLALSEHHSGGVSVHTSSVAGGGKSFDVRTRSAELRMAYAHVRVNGDVPRLELIGRIEHVLSGVEAGVGARRCPTLHIKHYIIRTLCI